MRYDAFLERVGDLAGIPSEDAERVSKAVLWTLSERLGPKESNDTASQLPKELAEAFKPPEWPQVFDADEFVRRVAERAGIDPEQARERTRAVFVTLQEAISPGEFEDWETYLTTDYVDLAARAADAGLNPRTTPPDSWHRGEVAVGPHEFIRRVAERAGLDEERARAAVDAVLETFGEKIAGGEAKDLANQLPEPAAEPLLRPGGDPRAIPVDEFVRRIAEREQTLYAIAREHARAVLTTVREAVTADEWDDTVAELPREYEELLV